MIFQTCSMKGGSQKTFSRLREYLGDPKKTAEVRVGNVAVPEGVEDQMERVARRNRKCRNPIYHYVLSWPPSDIIDDATAYEAVEGSIEALGFAGHQWMAARHHDTRASHVHVCVNRVNPQTLKSHLPRYAYAQMAHFCRAFEASHRLTPPPVAVELDWSSGHPILIHRHGPPLKRRTRDGEIWSGQMSLTRWAREAPLRAVSEALSAPTASWDEVHRALAEFGLRYEVVEHPDGRGGLLVDRSTKRVYRTAAASVDATLKLTALEARLGAYASSTVKVQEEAAYGRLRKQHALTIPEVRHPDVYPLFLEFVRLREAWADPGQRAEMRREREALRTKQRAERRAFEAALKRARYAALRDAGADQMRALDEIIATNKRRRAEFRERQRAERAHVSCPSPPAQFRAWLKLRANTGDSRAEQALVSLRQIRLEAERSKEHEADMWTEEPDKGRTYSVAETRTSLLDIIAHPERFPFPSAVPYLAQAALHRLEKVPDLATVHTRNDDNAITALLDGVEKRFGELRPTITLQAAIQMLEQQLQAMADDPRNRPPAFGPVWKALTDLIATMRQCDPNVRVPLTRTNGCDNMIDLIALKASCRLVVERLESQRHAPAAQPAAASATSQTNGIVPDGPPELGPDVTLLKRRAREEWVRACQGTAWAEFAKRMKTRYETIDTRRRNVHDPGGGHPRRFAALATAHRLRDEAAIEEAGLLEARIIAKAQKRPGLPLSLAEYVQHLVKEKERHDLHPLLDEISKNPDFNEHWDPNYSRRAHDVLRSRVKLLARNLDWEMEHSRVTFRMDGKVAFVDTMKSVDLPGLMNWDDRAVALALLYATERFGNNIQVNGSDKFKEKVLRVAVAYGLEHLISNPELQKERDMLVAARRTWRLEDYDLFAKEGRTAQQTPSAQQTPEQAPSLANTQQAPSAQQAQGQERSPQLAGGQRQAEQPHAHGAQQAQAPEPTATTKPSPEEEMQRTLQEATLEIVQRHFSRAIIDARGKPHPALGARCEIYDGKTPLAGTVLTGISLSQNCSYAAVLVESQAESRAHPVNGTKSDPNATTGTTHDSGFDLQSDEPQAADAKAPITAQAKALSAAEKRIVLVPVAPKLANECPFHAGRSVEIVAPQREKEPSTLRFTQILEREDRTHGYSFLP